MTKRWMVAIALLSSSPAFADKTVTGDPAAALARALKYAGVKSTTTKGSRVFQPGDIRCWGEMGADKDIADATCVIDRRTAKDAAAFLLQMSLQLVGVAAVDQDHKHYTNADKVSCTIEQSKFSCSWSTADLVTPVKIEKQPK